MSVKKSEFTAQTSIADGSTFDFVYNGQNFKVLKKDLLAALGTTGTLAQEGPITGVPVLDVQGTVNNIRNISQGPGILVQLDGDNGITISTSTEGVVIVDSPTSPYNMTGDEDYILCTGATTINAIAVADGTQGVNIGADGGIVTFVPAGADTTQTSSIADGDTVLLVPKASRNQWRGIPSSGSILSAAQFTATTTTAALGSSSIYAYTGTGAVDATLTISNSLIALGSTSNYYRFLVHDESGLLVTNGTKITIVPESGLIDGAASVDIIADYGGFYIETNGTNLFTAGL